MEKTVKMFTNQVSEIKENVNAQKTTANCASNQLSNAAKREKLGAKKSETPREIWAKFEKENALHIAAKVVAKSGVSYSFEAAKEKTKDFTLLLTTSETETKPFATIGAKTIYCKEIEPNSVDNVLRSFESCKLFFEATRIESAKIERLQTKRTTLLAAAAAALGVSIDELEKLQSK